ncbi:MAG: hypothetical protein IME94_01815 [Proteobacteria bacterium]|nr:hypothetical protein [Pseudomonadota bacterium]
MANKTFNSASFFIRLFFALILVFATYNPTDYSFYHWASQSLEQGFQPLMIFCSVVLLIGWAIYIRATITSLGIIGLVLAFAFFGTLLWVVIDLGIVSANSIEIITYIILVLVSCVLSIGMSWSHIRRRMSGQLDVNDTDSRDE